ncbi:MAG: hypothetical protein KC589_01705 [Nanoarchaeota archaeon]|nr:hypothetical protein [Nanoarchaeota archaeon]
MELTIIDFTFIVVYFILLIIIGFVVNKKESNEDFLISSRKLGLLSGISTINASKTGAIIMAYTALVFLYGVSAVWYFIGTLLGYLIFIPFAIKLYKQSEMKQYTLAEYFYKNYGKVTGNISNLLTIIIMLGFLIINLTAAATVFEFFTNISLLISAIIILSAILLYIILRGFKAVVKTDLVQYIAILGILIIIPIALLNLGNETLNLNINLFEIGAKNLFGFLLLGFLFPFASPELWQRLYALPNTKTLKKSILYSSLVYFIFGSLLTYIALLIRDTLPNIDPNIAFVNGLTQMLPAGLIGLTVVLLISAFMSSIDTYLYTASSAFVQNFMKEKNKDYIKKKIRITIFVFGIIGLILTILISNLVDSVYLTAFVVVLAIPTIITWIKPKIDNVILKFGFIIGMVVVLSLLPFEFLKETVDPGIILKGIGATLFGLFIGWLYSILKRKN